MQYNMTRGVQGLKVELINDPAMRFCVQLLASKLPLRNNMPNEVSVHCICVAAKCATGVTMSWAHFLAEEFRIDFQTRKEGTLPLLMVVGPHCPYRLEIT